MEICRLGEAESFGTPEGIIIPMFASKNIAVMHLKMPVGLKVNPHSHDENSILILISGSIGITGNEPTILRAGDLAYLPGGFLAGLECYEESTAVALIIPSGFENVEELSNVLRSFSGSGNCAT